MDPKEGKIQKDLTYRGRKTGGDEELSPSLAKTMLSPVSRFMVGVSRASAKPPIFFTFSDG